VGIPRGVLVELDGLAVDGQVVEIDLHAVARDLLVQDAEAIERGTVLSVAGKDRCPVRSAVDNESDLPISPERRRIVDERPLVHRPIRAKRQSRRRLIVALESGATSRQPVAGAVLEKHPVLAAVAVDCGKRANERSASPASFG
jgi:hypothetical protein